MSRGLRSEAEQTEALIFMGVSGGKISPAERKGGDEHERGRRGAEYEFEERVPDLEVGIIPA